MPCAHRLACACVQQQDHFQGRVGAIYGSLVIIFCCLPLGLPVNNYTGAKSENGCQTAPETTVGGFQVRTLWAGTTQDSLAQRPKWFITCRIEFRWDQSYHERSNGLLKNRTLS